MSLNRRDFLRATAVAGVMPSLPRLGDRPPSAVRPDQAASAQLRERGRREIVLTFVGDLFPMAFPERLDADTEAVFAILRDSNAAYANLEGGLSTTGSSAAGTPGGTATGMRGHPSSVSGLARIGIKAVSLANNHTGDFGPDAVLETIRTLDAAGVPHAGAGKDLKDAFAPAFMKVGGTTVALLSAYTYWQVFEGSTFEAANPAAPTTPGIAGIRAYEVVVQLGSGYNTRELVSPYIIEPERGVVQSVMAPLREDLDRLRAAVEEARKAVDFVILSVHIHWGRHRHRDIPLQQRTFAQAAVDAGVDLFVGHGPHTLRGIEIYRGKPIFYSLGNFTLNAPTTPSAREAAALRGENPGWESIVVRVTISGGRRFGIRGRGSGPEFRGIELVPIVIGEDRQPRVARCTDGQRILYTMDGLSGPLGTASLEVTDGVARVRL